MKACGNPNCSVSTGICGSQTFGSGELDDNGYWEHPCGACERQHAGLPPILDSKRYIHSSKDEKLISALAKDMKEFHRELFDNGGQIIVEPPMQTQTLWTVYVQLVLTPQVLNQLTDLCTNARAFERGWKAHAYQ